MLSSCNIFRGPVPIVPTGGFMMKKRNTTPRPNSGWIDVLATIGLEITIAVKMPVMARTFAVAIALLVMFPPLLVPALAQRQDSFEGGAPRWIMVESDCQAQLTEHEISMLIPHAGRTCEMFEIACGQGRLALLAYPIEPCVALNEFQPRIWTRCSSGRIQIGARVIFPFAEHPVTLGRLNTILWGDYYTDSGQWQMLQVNELEKRLQQSIISLRQEFGSGINLDGAFIDCIVLNAYTGPGRYRVQLDDLDLQGMVPLSAMGTSADADWRERWRWRYATPSREDRFWATANRPPVWFQHAGEPFDWLHSLGITGLVVNKLPSEQILGRIRDADLSVISPPPAHALSIADEVAPVIKGWLVGAALDGRQAEMARGQVQLVEQLPPELRRPLVGEALEQFWMYSRLTDEVIVPAPAPHSAGDLKEKFAWLAQQVAITRQRGHGWVSINVGETPATLEQYRTAARVIGLDKNPNGLDLDVSEIDKEIPCNPLGLRHQVTNAVLAGAQGLLFRSHQPLAIQGGSGNADVAALRWINNDLTLWGPWIMAGVSSQPPTVSGNDYVARAWNIQNSQLIIAQNCSPNSQYCVPSTAATPLSFTLSAAGARQVLRLTKGTLEPMQIESIATVSSWKVQRPCPIEVFVITDSPQVLAFLRNRLTATAIQNASDQLEIASYNLALAANVTAARFPASNTDAENQRSLRGQLDQLASIQTEIDRGWQALRANQARSATDFAYNASDEIQAILTDGMIAATANLAKPQSSPFVVTPALLSLHWKLAQACERSQWRDYNLPGAQLQNLNDLLDAGWTQQRRLEEQVDLRVEIVPPTSQRGGGLRMAAYSKQQPEVIAPVPGGYEGASLRVRSSAAPIRAGQLVRVSAVAHVLRASREPDSGLLIYDNQAGPSLGQLVRGAAGQRLPIELYRFAIADGEFRILAECRGECDIVLESIHASVIEPATDRVGFPVTPLGETPPVIFGELANPSQL